MVESVLIRPRAVLIAYGIAIGCFAIWLLFSPAGWPFYASDGCTWSQWIFARAAIPITGILAAYRFALDESKRILSVDATGFRLFDSDVGSWIFKWDEVSQWGLIRGGCRITESEGGTQFEVFHSQDETISITLVEGRQLRLALPIFGYTRKFEQLLIVLRRYVGDREAPVVVLRSDVAYRRKGDVALPSQKRSTQP